MNRILPQINQAQASLIAISPQTVTAIILHGRSAQAALSACSAIPATRVARQFGLVYRVPDYQQEVYRRVFINLPFVNGDESWELPIPATYVVDRKGVVIYASVNPDYTERPEPTEILVELKGGLL